MDIQAELKDTQRQLILTAILEAPGSIMLGLGLFGKFAPPSSGPLAFLTNSTTSHAMIAAGTVIILASTFKVIGILNRRQRLQARLSGQ